MQCALPYGIAGRCVEAVKRRPSRRAGSEPLATTTETDLPLARLVHHRADEVGTFARVHRLDASERLLVHGDRCRVNVGAVG